MSSFGEKKSTTPADAAKPPLLSIGVIADVQYANSDNGSDFKKTVVRRYRNSLRLLEAAVNDWTTQQETLGYPVQLLVQLGDLLDGRCQEANGDRDECLHAVMAQFHRFDDDTDALRVDIIGNHELYNFSREELRNPAGLLHTARFDELLQQPSTYYSVVPCAGLRLVIIDAFEICTMNGDENSKKQALDMLSKHNPNDMTQKGVDWTAGLEGTNKRFVPYNGAVSDQQLEWLSNTLALALENKEKCIVLSHISLQQGACTESCVLWNYEEVVRVLHNSAEGVNESESESGSGSGSGSEEAQTPVVACLYGHAHKGGYVQDDHGIHHVTLQSPLEAVGDEMCYGTLDVYSNRLVLRGEGRLVSRVLEYKT